MGFRRNQRREPLPLKALLSSTQMRIAHCLLGLLALMSRLVCGMAVVVYLSALCVLEPWLAHLGDVQPPAARSVRMQVKGIALEGMVQALAWAAQVGGCAMHACRHASSLVLGGAGAHIRYHCVHGSPPSTF